jgi:triosephosphate isomerase
MAEAGTVSHFRYFDEVFKMKELNECEVLEVSGNEIIRDIGYALGVLVGGSVNTQNYVNSLEDPMLSGMFMGA